MQTISELSNRIGRISVSSTMKVAADADRLRREGVDVVDFGAGEPDFPTPSNIKQAAIRAIEQNFTKYTAAGGTMELKQAICERHTADYGTAYSPAECVVSVGGKHIIFNLTQALLNSGDEVIIPIPYWVTYKDVVNYAGGKCVFVETDESKGFTFTAKMIEPYITTKTKLIIINSPSNPSGAVLDREEFERIFDLAKKRGIWLMTDECYCRFLYDSEPFSIASMPGAKETVLIAGSLSKTYSMTGWRIGFGLCPAAITSAVSKLQSHSTSNPTSIAQKAAVEALRGPQDSVGVMLAEYRKRRDFVIGRLRGIRGVTTTEPRGAFYAYPNISVAYGKNGINNSMQFAERLLAEAHVAVVPGEAFGTENHIRITYASSMEDLAKGLDRIQKFIENLG
jgi:aspartate aminotransferase